MFVVEMRDYSELRDVTPHLDRSVCWKDTNGDGIYDKMTVYAEDLPWPTGVICYDGGIFVAATPDILYFKDTDGDGKADIAKVVFTGYGAGKDRLNVSGARELLALGTRQSHPRPDRANGGIVKRPDAADNTALSFARPRLQFQSKLYDLRAENGGGQYG